MPAFLPTRRLRLTALAAALLCGPAWPAIVEFNGAAPVFLARGDFGQGQQTLEFAHRLDWEGYCNAHSQAVCSALTYWGSPGDWAGGQLPGAADDVRIGAGQAVIFSSYNSQYQGQLLGSAQVNYLGVDGSLAIGLGSYLAATQADIAHLDLSGKLSLQNGGQLGSVNLSAGQLLNTGSVVVQTLTRTAGYISGTGSTQILAIDASAPSFNTLVTGGQRLSLAGNFSGTTDLVLQDQSTFTNAGVLGAQGLSSFITGGGSFNPNTQSTVVNTGTLLGGFKITGARFNNDGLVRVDTGDFFALANGTHSGSFAAAAGTTLWFGNLGAAGHVFLPGSSVDSDGRVLFQASPALVQGSYRAALTELGASATVTFTGQPQRFDRIHMKGGDLHFNTPAGVQIGVLDITDAAFLLAFNANGASEVGELHLDAPFANFGGDSGVTVTGMMTWGSGKVIGGVTAAGQLVLTEGTRSLAGEFHNRGQAQWQAGGFASWTGTWHNDAGASLDVLGDFGVGANSGRFDNAGIFTKSAGAGYTTLGIAFDNSGVVEVTSGALRLGGGGTQSGSFAAAPGSWIELAGAQVIAGQVAPIGAVHITDGSLQVLAKAGYTNSADSRVSAQSLQIDAHGTLVNNGTVTGGAQVNNAGSIVNNGDWYAGKLLNQGSFTNNKTATLDAVASTGMFLNSGTLTVNTGLLAQGSFTNDGTINNHGVSTIDTALQNSGHIYTDAALFIETNASVQGTGTFEQTGGLTRVNGLLEAQGGITIRAGQLYGTGTLRGPVWVGADATVFPGNSPGTLSIDGDATLAGSGLVIEVLDLQHSDLLKVSGVLTLDQTRIELKFDPAYQPHDGDSFSWLSAARIDDLGSVTTVSGLTGDWQGLVAGGDTARRVFVFSDPATTPDMQIAQSGRVAVAQGLVAANFATAPTPPDLEELDNAGRFVNSPGATLFVSRLINREGASFSNRGYLEVHDVASNAGTLRVRPDGEMHVWTPFENTGLVANLGRLEVLANVNNAAGARIENSGRMLAYGINNQGSVNVGAGGSLEVGDNGFVTDGGEVVVAAGGRLVSSSNIVQRGTGNRLVVDGQLQAPLVQLHDDGRLSGGGQIVGDVELSGASIDIASTALDIRGHLSLYGGQVFTVSLDGQAINPLRVSGGVSAVGTNIVNVLLTGGYQPHIGDHYSWLDAAGGVSGAALTYDVYQVVYDDAGTRWYQSFNPSADMRVSFANGQIAFLSAVPEPPSAALAAIGVLALLAWRRRADSRQPR